jgi:hypothetical protein
MTPEINFAIAAERRADTLRAAARTAARLDHRTSPPATVSRAAGRGRASLRVASLPTASDKDCP